MQMIKISKLIFVSITIFISCAMGQSAGKTSKSENIALGKKYTFNRIPNYSLCTDSEDSKQLTDGKIVDDRKVMWQQKEAVGWGGLTSYITLDIGKVMPISGVGIHTASSRSAGVLWPTFVLIFVGDEPGQYYWAGDLIHLSGNDYLPNTPKYSSRWFRTNKLKTYGRYVCFAIMGNPCYTFLDEIEVYSGSSSNLLQPRMNFIGGTLDSKISAVMVDQGIIRRKDADLKSIREKVRTSTLDEKNQKQLISQVNALTGKMDFPSFNNVKNFQALLPFDIQHQEIFKIQAELWKKIGLPDLAIWSSGLWEDINPFETPDMNSKTVVNINMMACEYRAGIVNLSNTTQKPISAELQITGLPGGTNPDYIQVHEVQWTDTYNSGVVASALPNARRDAKGYVIEVIPGLTRQLWFTFHPTDVKPGKYEGQIHLKWGERTSEVPLAMTLYPLRFSDQPALHFGGWDYIDEGGFGGKSVTENNRDSFLELLRTHYVDSPWGTGTLLSIGQYNQAGTMIRNPDTTAFDRWLKNWPNTRRYYIYLAVNETFASFKMQTSEFQTAVKSWITFWMDHARQKGVKPEQIFLLTVDEPLSSTQDAIILSWAKTIHEAGTGVKIWEDPNHAQPNINLLKVCDAVCLNRFYLLNYDSKLYQNYLAASRGAEMQLYSCLGPSMSLDPYGYYRLQAWTCWKIGAKSTNFWSLSDTGNGSCWNEFHPGLNFCPFFLDDKSVTTAKQFEACREGIEDYEYFIMLKNAISKAEKNGTDSTVLTKAKRMLNDLPDQVLKTGISKTLRWHEKINRKAADQARVQILEMLTNLEKSK